MQFSVISLPRFRTFCNVILVLFHVTDIVSFYVKTMFMFQKNKLKKIKERRTHFYSKVRTIYIASKIICQRLFIPSLIIFAVVLKRSFKENSCLNDLSKPRK